MSQDLSDLRQRISAFINGIGAQLSSASSTASGFAQRGKPSLYTPQNIECVERVTYRVDVYDRVIYGTPEVEGEIRVHVPCTTRHLPWTLSERQWTGATVDCGILKFENCAEAILFDEETVRAFHTDTLDFEVPIYVPVADAPERFASGDTLLGVYRYQPRVAQEYPVTLSLELTDAPADRAYAYFQLPEEDRAATYLSDLYLKIRIRAQVSDLSQDMERGILNWIDEQGREARKRYEAWRRIVSALAEKQKVDPKALQEVGETQTPTPEAAEAQMAGYTHLSRCIQMVRDRLREVKGGLSVRDLNDAVVAARRESQELDPNPIHVLTWLADLKRRAGKEHGPRFRYVSVTWPMPEPASSWTPSHSAFPGGDWTYNPEQGCLECRKVAADLNMDMMQYEAGVELPLQRPTGDMTNLTGRVVVEIDRLLSGLDVHWQPANDDAHQAPEMKHTTVIDIAFDVDPTAVFKRRRFAVSRTLMFEGLLPSWARIRELKEILTDAGLTVFPSRRGQLVSRNVVEAIWRREGLPENWQHEGLGVTFAAILTGRQESVKHVLSYDQDRQRVERSLLVGSLGVEFRAIGTGDPRAVVGKVDELVLRLQERWGQGEVWQGTWGKEG